MQQKKSLTDHTYEYFYWIATDLRPSSALFYKYNLPLLRLRIYIGKIFCRHKYFSRIVSALIFWLVHVNWFLSKHSEAPFVLFPYTGITRWGGGCRGLLEWYGARVAELGSLSSGAKMAMKTFVKRIFTIFESNASFLRVIANWQN